MTSVLPEFAAPFNNVSFNIRASGTPLLSLPIKNSIALSTSLLGYYLLNSASGIFLLRLIRVL